VYGFSSSLWMLILGRVIVGFGAGNQVVSQVYFTYSTNTDERSLVRCPSLVSARAILMLLSVDYGYYELSSGSCCHNWSCPGPGIRCDQNSYVGIV
jgi:MFS family permease